MFDYRRLPSPRGRVQLLETVGKGNFGYVYKGRLIQQNDPGDVLCAVKVVQIKQEELREILLEVEILDHCSHPNITRYFETFLRNDDLWICMEFCGSGAVDSVYRALNRQLTEDEIAVFLFESFKGLEYLHSLHIIHRDIKSGNLLLTEDGQVKLADFGVSAVTSSASGYRAHSFIGTPYWMAPEVILSEESSGNLYDCKADIWSMGITAIEIADKNPPFNDIHPMRALHLIPEADPSKLMVQNPKKWSKPFISLISTCLNKDPRKRPSAEEILHHPWFTKTSDLVAQRQQHIVVQRVIQEVHEEKEKRSTLPMRLRKQAARAPDTEDELDEEEEYAPAVATSALPPVKEPVIFSVEPSSPVDQDTKPERKDSTSSGKLHTPSSPKSSFPSALSPLRSSFLNILRPIQRSLSKGSIDDASASETEEDVDEILDITDRIAAVRIAGPDVKPPFEMIPLGAEIRDEVLCGDIITLQLEKNQRQMILLLGTERGLFGLDVTLHMKNQGSGVGSNSSFDYKYHGLDEGSRLRPIIKGTRFKQISVMEDYEVVMAVAGRTNRIRSYALDSLKKLVAYTFGVKLVQKNETNLSLVPTNDPLMEETPEFWSVDYDKILHTKDSSLFVITRTKATVYMGVIGHNQITVFEWAKLPYLKFMKVKEFWMPETPKFFEIVHDGNIICALFVAYEREAVLIEFESSKVIEIADDPEWKAKLPKEVQKDKEQCRWLSWIQLPEHKIDADGTVTLNNSTSTTKQTQSLSWYQTIKTMRPTKGKRNGLFLDDRNFLASYGCITRRVDVKGSMRRPTKTIPNDLPSEYEWSRLDKWDGKKSDNPQPQNISPSRVLCLPEYIIGCHKNFLQILDARTGDVVQSSMSKYQLRMLVPTHGSDLADRRRGRLFYSSFNKKRKRSHLYWMRESAFDFAKAEADMIVRDDLERNARVIGCSVISNKILDVNTN